LVRNWAEKRENVESGVVRSARVAVFLFPISDVMKNSVGMNLGSLRASR
jgi:hypothetical protein